MLSGLGREVPSCRSCGSTVRYRAVIHILSTELFGTSRTLTDFPRRPDIVGIGMSDWDGYAAGLARKLGYTNTFLEKEPKLDIRSIGPKLKSQFDFVISSDVFEHVAPPVSQAFLNTRELLKKNGVLIFTVPFTREGVTVEHFPNLYEYQLVETNRGTILKNITGDGREEIFDTLVFHRGAGLTLEMRIFSETSIVEELQDAGFGRIRVHREHYHAYGIVWQGDWSLPITARAI